MFNFRFTLFILLAITLHPTLSAANSPDFIQQWGTKGADSGQLHEPHGIAVDSAGNVYVADKFNHRIQKFDGNGTLLTQWGSFGTGDGQFHNPAGVTVDSDDNVYVVDKFNYRIQKFNSSGTFITKWGSNGAELSKFQ